MKEKYRQKIIELLAEQPRTAEELKDSLGGKKHVLTIITEMYRHLKEITIVGSRDGRRVYGLPSQNMGGTVQIKTGTNPFDVKNYNNVWLNRPQSLRGSRY